MPQNIGTCYKYDDKTIYLRAATQEEYTFLLKFFTALGLVFESEQHGRGPKHYACQRGGQVFELYPAPKQT